MTDIDDTKATCADFAKDHGLVFTCTPQGTLMYTALIGDEPYVTTMRLESLYAYDTAIQRAEHLHAWWNKTAKDVHALRCKAIESKAQAEAQAAMNAVGKAIAKTMSTQVKRDT